MTTGSTPKHYHAWVPGFGNRGLVMFSAKLTPAEIRRQRERGSRRTVRRWWRSRQAARKALTTAGRTGFVHECDLGERCPERMHVLSN